jgi:hypothetical protein
MPEKPMCAAPRANHAPCWYRGSWRCPKHGWLCGIHSYFDARTRYCKQCDAKCVDVYNIWERRVEAMP